MQLPRLWAGRSALAWCLWPVSIVYGVLFWLRKQLYALGIFKSERVAASVIVVGNVVAGGAGKTPLTLALVQHLKAQNVHVGIVSRGYGRASMGHCASPGPGPWTCCCTPDLAAWHKAMQRAAA